MLVSNGIRVDLNQNLFRRVDRDGAQGVLKTVLRRWPMTMRGGVNLHSFASVVEDSKSSCFAVMHSNGYQRAFFSAATLV